MSLPPAALPRHRHGKIGVAGRVVYGLLIAGLTGTGIYLVVQTLTRSRLACIDTPPGVLPDYPLLCCAVVSLLVGRLLGRARYNQRWAELSPEEAGHSAALGTLAFLIFAWIAAAALVYEAFGVLEANGPQVPSPQPITEYVRCAIWYDKTGVTHGWITRGLVLVISGLIGHWFWAWHPASHNPPTTADDA